MFLQKKIDRAFKWLEEKNKAGNDDKETKDNIEEEDLEVEKEDYLAVIISALLVFAPILIILLIIAIWAFL